MVGETATIIKVDVDKNPNAAAAYQVQGVPTLIVFKKGEIKWRRWVWYLRDHLKQILQQNA